MSLLTGQVLGFARERRYAVHVPDDPSQATVPAIIVFHGGGQDPATIAARWGIVPGNPAPTEVAGYLLVFPAADEFLADEWVHYSTGDSSFPTNDLEFVQQLVAELTTRQYATASVDVPFVAADPSLLYAAGFSNGGGMTWQLLNSSLVSSFRGFAAVGKALDPEKALHYRQQLAPALPAPVPVVYVHGTADQGFRPPFSQQEVSLEATLPYFTVREMLDRNLVPAGPGVARLITGSVGVTEVVTQLFVGAAAFLQVTVINGGHNWPMPTTVGNPPVAGHFNATLAIVRFWRAHAGLP